MYACSFRNRSFASHPWIQLYFHSLRNPSVHTPFVNEPWQRLYQAVNDARRRNGQSFDAWPIFTSLRPGKRSDHKGGKKRETPFIVHRRGKKESVPRGFLYAVCPFLPFLFPSFLTWSYRFTMFTKERAWHYYGTLLSRSRLCIAICPSSCALRERYSRGLRLFPLQKGSCRGREKAVGWSLNWSFFLSFSSRSIILDGWYLISRSAEQLVHFLLLF